MESKADDLTCSSSQLPVASSSDNETCLLLIERIASSDGFQKSSRLSHLLRYLAEHSLRQDRASLSEVAIGRNVFEKLSDFNPAEDSSVRVAMRQLRLRLHEFYQSDGRDEAIAVEVPKGGYALTFSATRAASTPSQPLPASEVALPQEIVGPLSLTGGKRLYVALLPWVLFTLAFVTVLVGWVHFTRVATEQLPQWPVSALVHADRSTTVVLSDASYSLRRIEFGDVQLDDYIHRERPSRFAPGHDSRDAPLIQYMESAQITSVADAHASAVLVGLAGQLWTNLTFRSAKDISIATLGDGNFIFIGAKTSNPWVELYEGRLNFPFRDTPSGDRYVQNRAPQPGEQQVYQVTGQTGSSGEDYATISLIPNTSGRGTLLLIQGIRLEGTEAAIRFLADPDQRKELAQRLRSVHAGTLPRHFEVLLHAHSVAGSAVSIDCIAVRAIPN